jgi:OmcA/MtrC family decaheme c-type cytochrome
MSTACRTIYPAARSRAGTSALWISLLLGVVACNGSGGGSPPEIGIAQEPTVGTADSLPGVVVAITKVHNEAGATGNFKVGQKLTVDFTVKRADGQALELANIPRGSIMVSGPTSNYQRVIAAQSDLITASKKTALGAYSYTFAAPLPERYLPPLNDTTALTDGELTDQPLLSGTYTVGIELRKDYTVNGAVVHDPGNATADFLVGTATVIEHRELVTLANCNQCHENLRVHGDNRNNIENCLLCHTAGAEDRNTPTVAGGTPGVTIDFRVMIHKIHSGKHLPSVLGVATNSDGTRNYAAGAKPYEMIGYGDSVVDFSDITWPAWPSFYTPMPRDAGYTLLASGNQSLENTMRQAPVECDKCHGDPDGAGPLPAPAQGDSIYTNPSRVVCSSCHDDWDPSNPYTSNTATMPAQPDDGACKQCHRESGTALDVRDAHKHPLKDATMAAGLHFAISSVTDVGGNGNGKFDAGEKVGITFQVVDDEGTPIAASSLSRIEAILSGPTENPQMLVNMRFAQAYFTGTGPYTVNMPALYWYEPIGTSTGSLETFSTSSPQWNVTGAATVLLRRTGTGNSTTLDANAPVAQNYIDVASGTGSLFVKDNYIVIEDAVLGRREYMRVQWVDGDRLWFGNQFRTTYKPGLKVAHAAGSTVDVATTASISAANYSVDGLTGLITEVTEFGNGEILANYTGDFVVPSVYPGALMESPVNGEDWGDWLGLPILSGTYTLDMHGARQFVVTRSAENTTYTEGADATYERLLFGDATEVTVTERVVGQEACNVCHENIQFHGGSRRGFNVCIQCHGTAGAELAPVYENPVTGHFGASVEFRYFLHTAHNGVFPDMPGGVKDCTKCHGADNTAWTLPAERLHPSQTVPTRSWRAACSSCHDSSAQVAHIDANTSPSGAEACTICHGVGDELNVRTVHTVR